MECRLALSGTFFEEASRFAVGADSAAVVAADFNADGLPDLATADEADHTVSILLNNGGGLFANRFTRDVADSPVFLAAADLNHDADPDLITVGTSGGVSILLGRAGGAFDPAVSYSVGSAAYSAAVGDFTSDGHPDLIIARHEGGDPVLLIGSGTGAFTISPTSIYVTGVPGADSSFVVGASKWLAPADFNTDGHLDLVFAGEHWHQAVIGLGNGTFYNPDVGVSGYNGYGPLVRLSAAIYLSGGLWFSVTSGGRTGQPDNLTLGGLPAAVADLDRSGDPDVITVSDRLRVGLRGPGLDLFTRHPAEYPLFHTTPHARATAAAIADFDDDGNLDAAVASQADDAVTIFAGNGDGTFRAPRRPVSTSFIAGTPAFFSDDNRADLLSPVLSGQSTLFTADASGVLASAATLNLSISSSAHILIADFDADGRADAAAVDADGAFQILEGDGSGGLTPGPVFQLGFVPAGLAARDLNADARADLIATNAAAGSVAVLLATPSGFAPALFYDVGPAPGPVVAADADGDGRLDLAVLINALTPSGERLLAILTGTPGGAYGMRTTYRIPSTAAALRTADLNGDARADFIIAGSAQSGFITTLLSGPGGIASRVDYPSAAKPLTVAVADFDGDGRVDLATSLGTHGEAAILFGGPHGLLSDPVAFPIPQFHQRSPLTRLVAADFTGDGRPDLLAGSTLLASRRGGEAARTYSCAAETGGLDTDADGILDSCEVSFLNAPGRIHVSSDASLLTAAYIDDLSTSFVYQLQPTGEWWRYNSGTSLPAFGALHVLSFVAPWDGRTYLAVMQKNRLDIVSTSTKTAVATLASLGGLPIVSSPTIFISRDQTVGIAGLSAAGDLVLYSGSTAPGASTPVWSYTNLFDELRSQSITPPVFADGLVSYVTSWNGLNIAGTDPQGQVHTVWWAPELPQWTASNLSEVTGAPTLYGGLSVYLTSWGGINLTGLNQDGDVMVTWWVPGLEWSTANLTDAFDGPRFERGSLAAYTTSWDGLNIVGRRSDGATVVYWWAPGIRDVIGEDRWQVAPLSELISGAPRMRGLVTGHASPAGVISLFGRDENTDLVRYFWYPGADWASENVGNLATLK